eukprot:TRINITY_DN21399_c0_g1_i1.p1 TRINITY_DN21399_c0_g1~~TRINITY_DN21399_c0_g1_i1.p1  ORF type:complete len:596 (+),score=80.12 TRINITY_DN21399_c0_g1_i1:110-1897(+)
MLESVCVGNSQLSEAQSNGDSPSLFAVDETPNSCLRIARCNSQSRLELFFLHAQKDVPGGATVVQHVVVAETLASRGTSVTTLAWLPCSPEPLLCVGFSHGCVDLFTPSGVSCPSFLLWPTAVLSIRLGPQPTPGEQQKALMLHAGGVVTIFAVDDLRSATGSFQHELYELGGRESTSDICLLREVEPLEDPFELTSAKPSPGLIALGARPFISQHPVIDCAPTVTSLVGAAASAVASYTKGWLSFGWRGGGASGSASSNSQPPSELQAPSGRRPDILPLSARFLDPNRVGERLELAPRPAAGVHENELLSGQSTSLAASCDAFGRVAIFCVDTLRCLQFWKGYRDADVAWFREPLHGHLALVIYASRRGLLELWSVADAKGPRRIAASNVGVDCVLLKPLGGGVFLLRKNGRLDRVIWREQSSVKEHGCALGAHTSPLVSPHPESLAKALPKEIDVAVREVGGPLRVKEASDNSDVKGDANMFDFTRGFAIDALSRNDFDYAYDADGSLHPEDVSDGKPSLSLAEWPPCKEDQSDGGQPLPEDLSDGEVSFGASKPALAEDCSDGEVGFGIAGAPPQTEDLSDGVVSNRVVDCR